MKIFVIGAGQVGTTIVEALHGEHDVTVLDLDPARLAAISQRFDVATLEANGASRRALADAGVRDADLVLACTSRDEANLVAGTFARLEAPRATTVIRASNVEYIELWRQGQLDVDFVVSSEIETAHAIARVIGVSAAVQTDVFADGQVQLVEYDVTEGASAEILGRPLRDAVVPADSRVAAIIRGGSMTLPRGDDTILAGDRIVVIGSPQAATAWGKVLAPWEAEVKDVVIFGAGRVGTAIARELLEQGIGVRLIEENRERARAVAEAFPKARVYNVSGLDPDFLAARADRVRAGRGVRDARGREEPLRRHARPHPRRHVHDRDRPRRDLAAGLRARRHRRAGRPAPGHRRGDRPLRPRPAHAAGRDARERPLRGARHHDPADERVRRAPFREMPIRGALIGAIVRDGQAVFPRSDDTLQAGDRVIVFTESERVPDVERVL